MLCNEVDVESTVAALRAGLPGGAEPSRVHLVRGQFFVEVLHPNATKAHALRALLGEDLSSVVAFGDADNDVEMLRGVGPAAPPQLARPARSRSEEPRV